MLVCDRSEILPFGIIALNFRFFRWSDEYNSTDNSQHVKVNSEKLMSDF